MKLILSVILMALLSNFAFASQTSANWMSYSDGCSYFSTMKAKIYFYYSDENLPHQASVALIYGLGNKNGPLSWEHRKVTTTIHSGISNVRQAMVDVTVVERGSPVHYDVIQFVWEVTMPNGEKFYDKGSSSTWGFYQADIWSTVSQCSDGNQLPIYRPLSIYTIDRES